MRMVLDTNVLVSALLSPHGLPDQLLQHWEMASFVLVTSTEQREEISRVLAYPKLQRRIAQDEASILVNKLGVVADVATGLPAVASSPDPDDNIILATAIAGKADYVVTGDKKHLLALGSVDGISIITVQQAVELLENASFDGGGDALNEGR